MGAHEIIYVREVTRGLLNRTVIHTRECFAEAIREHAAAIVYNPKIFDNKISRFDKKSHSF